MKTSAVVWGAIAASAAAMGGYAKIVRPWHMQWGATEEETGCPMPGDDLVPNAMSVSTRALAIQAAPEQVWPWLVQMGQGRGGLYSYEWLENLAGCDIHNAGVIVPDWQQLQVGDMVRLAPEKVSPEARLEVTALVPNRYLVLASPGISSFAAAANHYFFSWCFLVEPDGASAARLLVRSRYDIAPRAVGLLSLRGMLEPMQFVMEQKMMRGIKERAEVAASVRTELYRE